MLASYATVLLALSSLGRADVSTLELPVSAMLAGSAIVSLLVWDVRRAGGLAAWAEGMLVAVERWMGFLDQRAARRARRRRAKRRA